jgi:predicted metalloprotease with PDZ domain
MPGRSVRSAERASFDTWIKQYRPDENSINSTVSYYRKGALIGFVTDMAIRRASGNRSSLDDLMRAMYRRFGPQGSEGFGYPPGAFEQQIEALAGPDVRARTENLLTTTDDPPVDEALQWYGLELERDPERTSAETSGNTPPLGFGVTWETSGQKLIVDQVILGYSGAQAGLLPGDELLAVDGWRITAADYLSILQRLRPGEDVAATISRRGQLRELTLQVQHEVPESFRILVSDRISRRQKERLEAWLGRELKFSGR